MPLSEKAKWLRAAVKVLNACPRRILGRKELIGILDTQLAPELREVYSSATSKLKALAFSKSLQPLELFRVREDHIESRALLTKYIWRQASALEVAMSLRPDSYISHATAARIHGLQSDSKTIYVNKEQTAKPRSSSGLSQSGIDRAFSSRPRESRNVLTDGKHNYVLLNGKNTGRLGVMPGYVNKHWQIEVTNIERTIIDMIVRPQYAGGVAMVLESIRNARTTLSMRTLMTTLTQLDHVYPYHQALGLYLELAGYSQQETDALIDLGISYDFYLEQGSSPLAFNERWRVHYPERLV